jgi:cation transport ATPase
VAFDKTGTLTTGRLRLDANSTRVLERLDPRERAALAALVGNSGHPKSVAVRVALGGVQPAALDVEEHVGAGLSASGPDGEIRLGRPGWASPATSAVPLDCDLVLSVGGVARALLVTEEEPREDARAEIQALVERGLRVAILSGDRMERVRRIAQRLGLARLGVEDADVLGDLSPEQKADWLRRRGEACLFVGDGVNDTLAADAAFVAATPSIERPFLPARADFVFTSEGIAPVRWALLEAERLRRIARINVAFAIVYNLVGGTLAVVGAFHPWVAAVLMPASSIFVVSRTWLSFGRGVESLGASPPVRRASPLVTAPSSS